MTPNDLEQGDGIPASNGEGWDQFNEANERAMKAAQERADLAQKELDRAFARMAATADGAIVMQAIEAMIENMDDFNPALGFYNGAAYGFWRTGNRNLLKLIKRAIARGGKA